MRAPPLAGTLAVMNPQSHRGRARAATAITVLAATALVTAACGGSPSAAGSGGSPSAGASAGAGGSSGSHLLAYSSCMRSHGVPNFPDPDGSGQIPKEAVISAARSVSASQFQAAGSACEHLAPAGLGPAPASITAQDHQYYLRAIACMRSHGFTNIPDPVFSGSSVHIPLPSSVDTSSPQFVQAVHTCEKLIPSGLPYSGSGSGS
jgi:hypothetical protein